MGLIATGFIVKRTKAESGYDRILIFVDRFTRRIHFIPSNDSDIAVDVESTFFS